LSAAIIVVKHLTVRGDSPIYEPRFNDYDSSSESSASGLYIGANLCRVRAVSVDPTKQ